jgi:uncharacterized membrane protein (UPF0127 family)
MKAVSAGVVAQRYGRDVREVRMLGPRGLDLRAMVPWTRAERTRGLLGRSGIDADEALLLERTRSIHTFGMHFPIGVALLDRDLVVRSVRTVRPGRLVLPRLGTRQILECAKGVDLRPGDRLRVVETG